MKAFWTACAAAAALLAGPASAATITATVTGTVNTGHDGAGIFGAVGADLTGDAYVATFSWDTDIIAPHLHIVGSAGNSKIVGNPSLSGGTESGFGDLTINGQTLHLDNGVAFEIGLAGNGVFESISGSPGGSIPFVFFGFNGGNDLVIPTDFATPFDGDPCAAAFGLCEGQLVTTAHDIAHLTITNLKISSVGDFAEPALPGVIPEPATWSLMLAGFLGIGAALRRRTAIPARTT